MSQRSQRPAPERHARSRLAQLITQQPFLRGSLVERARPCGKPTCRCADPKDPGHSAWTLTFMAQGKRRVERIPKTWAEVVAARVRAGREFQDAIREVLTANAELLVLARKQKLKAP